MIQVAEHIRTLKPYIPGKPLEELERELGIKGSIKLASNENPLGPSPSAIKAVSKSLKGLNRYPDGSGYYLKKVLSERLQVSPEEIILGNGSNEIIEVAIRTVLLPGDEAIMAHPSFVVYPMIVQAMGGKSIVLPLKDWRYDLYAMASKITGKTRVIFIANPNNPTGTINTKEEMDNFMEKVPDGVLVIVDEAYCEYVEAPDYADSFKYFRQGKDILILRTFSKIYGLAGLRIGYGIAKSSLIKEMNKVRQPFNTNSAAQKAAIAALSDTEHIMKSMEINREGKEYLYKELKGLKIDFVPTEANFVYLIFKDIDSTELYEKMLRCGVIVRPVGPKEIRVTIGLPEENRRFMEAMKGLRIGGNNGYYST
ncbi:MAG TPA: histidinol-phosphate transaminase [Nitrospiraceae bacterium]|nr:histidinol-phosphate transaminase [Nitrospiraceae bacterium]